ncbi:NAD(+)--dinitrogen-reductase ADP-D-ribosyltransferase [Orenia marismortui]|uniref:Dinitrogenase reductase ADP-ribosyltransferase (DRAT) n=1 Tax=Orenia marismortui TaxID=46469 RepID=A0A4V3GW98_9FIRM|nr:NAD(+)--dinitrogen-reductase ADP-D-ribosyltransferase [Orenia marismortui]TDX43029.1 dinitrogenase reductase ADP-ribosyltransferase (DRAT) [Orenia marismortui]
MNEKIKQKYKIENDIINLMLFRLKPYICERLEKQSINSTSHINEIDSIDLLSRILLTHCVQNVFKIYRLPGYEEEYRYYWKFAYEESRELFSSLTDNKLNELYEKIREIYNFTQRRLKKDFNINNQKIILYRGLTKHEIIQVSEQLKAKKDIIKFKTNIINLYTPKYNLACSKSPMLVKREISIKDILVYYKYFHFHEKICNYSNLKDEMWIINKNSYGEITVKAENFEWTDYDIYKFKNDVKYIDFNFDYYFYSKPCKNKYIDFVINLKHSLNNKSK